MKKLFFLFFAVLLAITVITATAAPSGKCGINLTWTLDDEGTLTISGTGKMTDWYIDVPPWNSYKSSIKTVIIEEGVTSIGTSAFSYCTSITNVVIPESVTAINEYAFNGCTALTNVTISADNVCIGYLAFSNCSGLTRVDILGDGASLGQGAFESCTSLTDINLSNDVYVGYKALYDTAYYNDTFNWENGVLYLGEYLIQGGLVPDVCIIKDGTKRIGERAFFRCEMTSVVVPDSVTAIDGNAFESCEKLTSIVIPDSVTSINSGILARTAYYEDASNWDNGALYVGNHFIEANASLSGDYVVKDGTKVIAEGAFWECNATSITIPDSVIGIGDSAFDYCTSLVDVIVDENNNNYTDENGVLYNKDKTKLICVPCRNECGELTVPDSITTIDDWTFNGCVGLTSVSIPESVTSIGDNAFYRCTNLANVNILGGVTSIGDYAFYGCTALTSVTIPESVTSIGKQAFYGCSALMSVTIPDSVTYIGEEAFGYYSYANKVSGFTIYGQIKTAAHRYADSNGFTFESPYIAWGKFGDNLEWTLDRENTLVIWGTGEMEDVLYDYNIPWHSNKDLIKTVKIEEGVTNIGYQAFYNCTALTSITIPDSVTSIGDYAFFGCSGVTSIAIPNSVTSIGYCAIGYYYDNNYLCQLIPDLTIFGYSGTTAEKYADDNSISFISFEQLNCEHSFGDWMIPDASCTEDTVKTRECSLCGIIESETISAIGHSYSSVVTLPNCTDDGYTTHVCQNCGDTYTDSETEATGHSFNDWRVETEPTIESEGIKVRECFCGERETESIPRLEVRGAIYTLSSATASPGETVKLTLSLKSDVLINSIAISNLTYDSEVLEFIGFSDYEHMEEKCMLNPVFDDTLKCIVLALSEAEAFDGDICTLEFKIKETASDCSVTVSATPLAKLDGELIASVFEPSEVEVYTYVRGDIDGDDDVDIDDATYLFCYSMLPEIYPLNYKGKIDFVQDGSIDVKDAVMLFNYSMLPDIYPIS